MTDNEKRSTRRERIEDKAARGIRCPGCNCAHAPVVYTRDRRRVRLRRRQCRNCGRRFSTTETIPAGEIPNTPPPDAI